MTLTKKKLNAATVSLGKDPKEVVVTEKHLENSLVMCLRKL